MATDEMAASPDAASAEAVVQRQLDAYNAHDLDAWLATYDTHASQHELHGNVLARGHAEIRARSAPRFGEPNLFARLLKRIVMGNVVVDHEEITRTFAEGPGTIEAVCVYKVGHGVIQHATFAFGAPLLR